MSLSDFGKSLKKGLATAMGVPEIKQKVLAATSNDPWGPTGQQMREIADATHHYAEFGLIMESIWERLNEPGKYWRHVYKALLLLDYLLKNGADQCVREARVKMIEIKTLTEFQHIDDKDKDQGLSVRERAKAIVELLHDERRLNEERSKARANRDKFSNAISSDQARYGGSYGGGGGGGGGRSYQSKRPTGPPSYVDEQDFEPPSRTSPGGGSAYGGGGRSHHASKNNDLDFSSGDDMDDEFPDYQSPATPAARQPARQPEPPRPAPAPAPLIDLLGGEPARPAPGPDPNAGFFGATPAVAAAPAGFAGFPGAAPAGQFGGFAQAPAASGFPGGFAAAPAATIPGGFGGYPAAAAPATVPGGFPTGPGPAAGGFSLPTATTTTAAPAAAPAATPAFFHPTPGSSEADWGSFQSGPAPEPVKPPEPALDPSDPWARNDLFSFSKDKPATTTASTVKKTPMGAAGVKPTIGTVPGPVVTGNPNMFGMTAAPPTAMGGYPTHAGFVGQPQPGFGMVATPAPGGFGIAAPAPGGFGMAAPAPGGFGMAAPGGFGITPGMPMMGAYPGYAQR